MRTTVDIPDELFRRAKSEAALRGRRLKDLVEEGLRLILAMPPGGDEQPPSPKPSLHELMKDTCGIIKDAPEDYATNPKYLDDFGR